MLFNSIVFLCFLPIVFMLYWFATKSRQQQNVLIVLASYVFYGWWDWRFLFLIALSSVVDYSIGLLMVKTSANQRRKLLLGVSIAVNLGILGFFKYFNFFESSLIQAFNTIGITLNSHSLQIVLPVGISFYTFQTMSYTLDLYRGKLKTEYNIVTFFAFVSFFPQLVAGPIERAANLLPQFNSNRTFNRQKATDGMRQILWGFFKKIVIADNCAILCDSVFDSYQHQGPIVLILGVFFFAFQIYCDFSGYSDIAIGTARLFGFDLMQNFAFPYLSRNIAEFWRRWHISLSTWFRDYVYIPLGGSYGSKMRHAINLIITFTVSGLWHGANWTFVTWGFLNGLYYLPYLAMSSKTKTSVIAEKSTFPRVREMSGVVITFSLTLIAWIFFRANTISDAFEYLNGIFSADYLKAFHQLSFGVFTTGYWKTTLILIFFVYVIEYLQRFKKHALSIEHFYPVMRMVLYVVVILTIVAFGQFGSNEFIYFQF